MINERSGPRGWGLSAAAAEENRLVERAAFAGDVSGLAPGGFGGAAGCSEAAGDVGEVLLGESADLDGPVDVESVEGGVVEHHTLGDRVAGGVVGVGGGEGEEQHEWVGRVWGGAEAEDAAGA